MGSLIFTRFLYNLLTADSVNTAWETTKEFDYSTYYAPDTLTAYDLLLSDSFHNVGEEAIGETGYVVDSLMAAVYNMLEGTTYENTVLCTINLGYDTDTNAAITGALAASYYGVQSIPERWLSALRRRDYLEDVAKRFAVTFNYWED